MMSLLLQRERTKIDWLSRWMGLERTRYSSPQRIIDSSYGRTRRIDSKIASNRKTDMMLRFPDHYSIRQVIRVPLAEMGCLLRKDFRRSFR